MKWKHRLSTLGLAVILAVARSPSQVRNVPPRDAPLIVGPSSRMVLMEYEAWFGPRAMTFSANAAMPLLQSSDMVPFGGGYDSSDPAVIRRHVEWLEELGIDAVLLDLTNDISCTFNSEWFVKQYLENTPGDCPLNRPFFKGIRDNTRNIYPAWQALDTRVKVIPQLGGIDLDVLYKDIDGKTAFAKEIDYFAGLMEKYPDRQVIYEGKPLMLIYIGAGQDPNPADNPLWLQIRTFLKEHPAIANKFTFRMIAGYLDSQPELWTKGDQLGPPHAPVEIDPLYGFWSFVDRLDVGCKGGLCPYYPSYTRTDGGSTHGRVENFTASIATAGQDGWGCPNPDSKPYCEDDALRFQGEGRYATFHAFMGYARKLDPIFLILHQFNEFVPPDEGFDANTNDDIEPANEWGYTALTDVREQLRLYRCGRDGSHYRVRAVPPTEVNRGRRERFRLQAGPL